MASKRAPAARHNVRCELVAQRCLADTGLTGEHDQCCSALDCFIEGSLKLPKLGLPPDESSTVQ